MPYKKCFYNNCKNTSQDISMFRFPVHDQGRLNLWIRYAGNDLLNFLTNDELKNRHICAAHFSESSFHQGNKRCKLLGPAIPLPFHIDIIENTATNDHQMEIDLPPSPTYLKVKTPTKFYVHRRRNPPSENTESSPSTSSMYKGTFFVSSPKQTTARKCLFEGSRRLSMKSLLQQDEKDSPKTKHFRSTVAILVKKNKALQAKINRLKKKVNVSKNVDNCKVSSILINIQNRNLKQKKPWSVAEKNFCLSLFYKSPATYKFLRRQGVVLAAPSTIRMWLCKSSCFPGLESQVFTQLNNRFSNSSIKDRACIISFDEMAIMENFEYSKKYDIIEGYEDSGKNHRTNKAAKYALVFLVRGLYNHWKLPVAYFLSNTNMKAEYLLLYLKALVNKLFDHGLLPKAVVCDQMSTNQKLFKLLGVSNTEPFFFCNERKLFALYDVPHLIKNVRNNLINNDYLYNNTKISFKDIVKTYEIDQSSKKSRSLTKINYQHINPNPFQKMKVSLATQILSSSVAAAILTAKSTGQLQSETAEATANFIKIVNNLFDALNSKRLYNKNPYKCALSEKSTHVRDSIIKGKIMFASIKKISFKTNKYGVVEEIWSRPPCFDGVIQSCEAVMQLYAEEHTENMYFLLTSKLNQDVIENLFARLRGKGGSNRNPTAKLLRTIFRSNLINSLIKLPTTKNCEDEVEEFIEPTAVKPPSPTRRALIEIETNLLPSTSSASHTCPSHSYTLTSELSHESENLSPTGTAVMPLTLEDCSVSYFAGYLAFKCLNKFHDCENCIKALTKKEIDLNDEAQLLILNKSYDYNRSIKLKMPSNSLIKLINLAISGFNLHFESMVHLRNVSDRLYESIITFLRSEGEEHMLHISCDNHISFILKLMIFVKLYYFCKIKKHNDPKKTNAKVRILKNK